jgi:hypothetical protein
MVLLQASLASAGPSDSGDGHDTVLEFDVQFSPFSYTDLGDPGPSPADLIVFHDHLRVDGTEVGHEVGGSGSYRSAGVDGVLVENGDGTEKKPGTGTLTLPLDSYS